MCNDGSPGAWYFHKASDPAMANIWLVYLEGTSLVTRGATEARACPASPTLARACAWPRVRLTRVAPLCSGGDWCYSSQTCAQRYMVSPQFMSSNGWPGVISLGGIMDESPAKSPWAGANKAYLGYCSSDAWVGDVPASPETFNLAFRGQRIITAALQMLVTNHGMGSTPGERLLFAGCSAGSRGAMFTADYVGPMLEQMGVDLANIEIQALFDSPMWVDVEPITGPDGVIVPLEVQTQAILTLVGASNRLGVECANVYQGAEAWKCLYGQYRLPYVQTPYAVNAAQFDKFQVRVPIFGGGKPQARRCACRP